jgi:hypothetical protein
MIRLDAASGAASNIVMRPWGLTLASARVSGRAVIIIYKSVIMILQSLTVMMDKCTVGILQFYTMVLSSTQSIVNERLRETCSSLRDILKELQPCRLHKALDKAWNWQANSELSQARLCN